MTPGDIYMADLPDYGRRPIVIVSRPGLNRGNSVLAVPFISTHFEDRKDLPNSVPFAAGEFGLFRDCVAQCEQVGPVMQTWIDFDRHLGTLDEDKFRSVIQAIGYALDADCEPA